MKGVQNYIFERKQKRRRSRRFFYSVTGGAGTLFFIIIFLWIFLASPIFAVKQIELHGGKTVTKDDVVQVVAPHMLKDSLVRSFLGFAHMFAWPSGEVGEDHVALLPAVKRMTIDRHFFTRTVEITIEERVPVGVWCTAGERKQCAWFDEEGTIFKKSLGVDEGTLIKTVYDYSSRNLQLGDKVLAEVFLPKLFSIFRVMDSTRANVKEIRLRELSLQELEVHILNGPILYFSLRFPADLVTPVLSSLMSRSDYKKLSMIDFRVEHRVYYK